MQTTIRPQSYPTKTTAGLNLHRFFIGSVAVSLALFGLGTPSHANTALGSTEMVDSLVVKYELGASVQDKSGDPNGADFVTSNIELNVGENLGLGYRTIKFDQPIPVAQAQKIAEQLAGSRVVELAEPNYEFTVDSQGVDASAYASQTIATDGNWGLDRIDQLAPTVGDAAKLFNYSSSGTGVTIYIVDSGVRATHDEFQLSGVSRVQTGYSDIAGYAANEDCFGHGTHVAGIAAGKTYGVAKTATIVPVKVLTCAGSGTTANLIAGINWITANHSGGTAVANFSLGPSSPTGQLESINLAMAALIADGVQPVIASGNGIKVGATEGVPQDACNFSPANSNNTNTITVSASTETDLRASFSNYGTCVDIFAPGLDITSSLITSDITLETNLGSGKKSGTSMATPFVTGVVASLIQESPNITITQIWAMISAEATSIIPADGYGTTTKLLYQPSNGWTASTKATTALQLLAEQEAAAAAAKVAADRLAAERAAASAAAPAPASGGGGSAGAAPGISAGLAETQNSIVTSVKNRLITIRVNAPANSTTQIQILTSGKRKVAYQKAYKAREKYTEVNAAGQSSTKYRSVTKYKTAYRTTTEKYFKTVNNSQTSATYSKKVKSAGTYQIVITTPMGNATSAAFRVR